VEAHEPAERLPGPRARHPVPFVARLRRAAVALRGGVRV
jgi:hypothetical protein